MSDDNIHTNQDGLGRVVSKPDARDKNFMLAPRPEAASKEHHYWTTKQPLDQLNTPHCVGFAGYQWLTSFPVSNKPRFSPEQLYNAARTVDEWPGEDYDGTSVRGLFKILKREGYVSEYRWADNVDAIVDHLLMVGPVVVGTAWTEGMFMDDRNGFIDDVGGRVVGGHAYCLVGANRTKKAVRMLNSWGPSWANNGRAWISFEMLDWLIKQDGEACTATELRA